jgi:hypothetical protein
MSSTELVLKYYLLLLNSSCKSEMPFLKVKRISISREMTSTSSLNSVAMLP